jgi:hypothetical protein
MSQQIRTDFAPIADDAFFSRDGCTAGGALRIEANPLMGSNIYAY